MPELIFNWKQKAPRTIELVIDWMNEWFTIKGNFVKKEDGRTEKIISQVERRMNLQK